MPSKERLEIIEDLQTEIGTVEVRCGRQGVSACLMAARQCWCEAALGRMMSEHLPFRYHN